MIRRVTSTADGIIVNTGPTGSGKSTTMHAILADLRRPHLHIHTIENPVERRIDGYRQMEVKGVVGVDKEFNATYANLLRASMRMDPDIILVGEVRDSESAQVAMAAANTGHFVLTTLHANTALMGIQRLFHFDVEVFALSQSVKLLMAQRLVPRLCASCSKPTETEADLEQAAAILDEHGYPREMTWAQAGLTNEDLEDGMSLLRADQREGDYRTVPDAESPILAWPGLRHPRNCPLCRRTGFAGRVGVFSLVRVTDPMRRLMLEQARHQVDIEKSLQQEAYENGSRTLMANGLLRVMRGETAFGMLVRELGPDYGPMSPL
jgi:type II secretory ATPase GspE/PulE/Tfp pilus assembly ATPase PilB-like protein